MANECEHGDCGVCFSCASASLEVNQLEAALENRMRHLEMLQRRYQALTGRRFVPPLRIGGCICGSGEVLIVTVTETVATLADGEPCVALRRGVQVASYSCPRCGAAVAKGGGGNG